MANNRLTTEQWLQRLPEEKKIKYDYSKTVYTLASDKVVINCRTCGHEFMQRPESHENRSGCPICAKESTKNLLRLGRDEFIAKAKTIVKEDYDYSLVEYKNTYTKVSILCKESDHGVFQITPRNFLQGGRCQKCMKIQGDNKRRKTQEEFLEQLSKCEALGITYEYIEYKNDKTKVVFNCAEHGKFSALPQNFLHGTRCPDCSVSGYKTGKPGHLYILSDGVTTKVGITNLTPSVRARSVAISGGPTMDVITDMYFNDGSIPLKIENAALKYLRRIYKQPSEKFGGSTECFFNVDIQDLLRFITPIATTLESE